MKKFFYLLYLFFSFCSVTAQEKLDSEEIIIEKLNYLKKNQNSLDPKKQETMLLQLKATSEKLDFEKGIFLSGDYLMTAYNKQDKNTEIVELANQLKELSQNKEQDPTGVLSSIYRKNALALMYLGLDDASKKDVETAIRYAKTIGNPDRKFFRLTQSYMDLFSHYKNKNAQSENKSTKDSILYYLNKSLNTAEKIKDNNGDISNDMKYAEIIYTYMAKGIFYLEYSDEEKGNLELAETNLLKAEKISNTKNSLAAREEAVLLNQLSWLYMEKKDFQKSIDYANLALQLEKKESRPTARVESFEFLATCYMEIGDKEKSKFYMQKYTFLKDSLNIANRKNADVTLKKTVAEVDKNYKEYSKKQWIIAGILSLIAAIAIIIYWRRRNKILRKTYEQMIDKLENEQSTQLLNTDLYDEETAPISETEIDDEQSHSLSKNLISSRTEARILKRLETFEKSEKFLRKDLTVGLLASQLNTNSKYLSEIIKNNKSQSFSNYINNLKINYILLKLYNDPKYRGYKISYLAEACGYASPQVFVLAFKKITGVTPSYFIQSLEEEITQ